jgi:hypothetical protein
MGKRGFEKQFKRDGLENTLDEIEKSGGLLQINDVKFIVMNNQVTGILSVDDMIYHSATSDQDATTYQIKYLSNDPLHICYFIGGRAI